MLSDIAIGCTKDSVIAQKFCYIATIYFDVRKDLYDDTISGADSDEDWSREEAEVVLIVRTSTKFEPADWKDMSASTSSLAHTPTEGRRKFWSDG